MKTIPLTEQDTTTIRNSFTYDSVTGVIKRTPVPGTYLSKSSKEGVNGSPTVKVYLPTGRVLNMPTPRLAYILAFGKEPTGRVSLDRKPSSPTEPMDLRKENLRLPGEKTPRSNVRTQLSLQEVKDLREQFLYDEESGIITKNPARWTDTGPKRWCGLNMAGTTKFKTLQGDLSEISLPRLAYILAYGVEPVGKATVVTYPKSGLDPLDLRKKNLKLA